VRLTEVEAVLTDRLLPNVPQPLAVAVSGGGDSLALMLAAHGWAKAHGRELLVLTVDHRLQAAGADWAAAVQARAERLGVRALKLTWEGPKPERGLPAAARLARHRLLAEAARAEGARVILMGHTADDVLEARAMRAAGGSTPEPREWGPSPVWPEGRGLFILRPLLGQRRAGIRDWLTARGETWIDDPANEDLRYARPRARRALAAEAELAVEASLADATALARACRMDAGGGLSIARTELRAADPAAAMRFLSAACLCAAGQARPPRRDRLERLAGLANGVETFAATLTGARVEGDGGSLRFFREAGEAARGGLAACALPHGETTVWDGRFELVASRPGL
jgi:tRNA(Ile)-lysidine synthase